MTTYTRTLYGGPRNSQIQQLSATLPVKWIDYNTNKILTESTSYTTVKSMLPVFENVSISWKTDRLIKFNIKDIESGNDEFEWIDKSRNFIKFKKGDFSKAWFLTPRSNPLQFNRNSEKNSLNEMPNYWIIDDGTQNPKIVQKSDF
jgi:hypothetical protein